MVVHGCRRDSRASWPVGIFPDGPIQGHASGHENHAGGLPTAAFQHPMGGRFWRVARRTLISDFAVIWSSICAWLLLQPVTGSIADVAASIFGLFYLGFLPSHWLSLRNLTVAQLAPGTSDLCTSGLAITLSACLMIVCSDIGSWAFGRRWGRRPLSPISPGKTVEGALGGCLCAMAMGEVCALVMGWPFLGLPGLLLGALVALIAMVGDLTESMMKRDAGIKDSGDVLPGHGGILDRIDSYLFTPAVVYYVIALIQPVLVR